MGRKLHLINELKRLYVSNPNPERDRIVEKAINDLKALTNVSEVYLDE